MQLTRRALLLTHVGLVANTDTGVRRVKPVNNHQHPTLSTNTLYVYERDRFRAMYMIENNTNDNESCFVVKHRVDWYDPIEEKPRSVFDSTAYITDKGGEN